MTFVEAFYSFNIELSHTNRELYESLRFKTPKHPYESFEHLIARILAYLHSYEQGTVFSRGYFERSEPTIWRHDAIGIVLNWAEVGELDERKLKKSLRQNDQARHAVYFYTQEQALAFCHHLRGSKSNWIDSVDFYMLDFAFLETIAAQLESSNKWSVMLIDDNLYISMHGQDFESRISELDVWQMFQESIGNTTITS